MTQCPRSLLADGSALGEQGAQPDLMQDPLTGEPLGGHTDDKAEHGGASIESFGETQLFQVDLGGGGVLEPTFVGLGAAGHDVRTGYLMIVTKQFEALTASLVPMNSS